MAMALTSAQMIAIIQAGGSVSYGYRTITTVADVPSDAQIAADLQAAINAQATQLLQLLTAGSGVSLSIVNGQIVITSSGAAPGGGAGGVLGGTYPNPSFAADMATQAELDAEASARSSADALRLLIANNLSDLANKATARSNLGIDGRTTVADANATALATDKYIGYTSLTAARVVTLPAANSVNAGYALTIADESGNASSTLTITIQRAGSDTINGATSYVMGTAYGSVTLRSNGVSGWFYDVQGLGRGGTSATSAAGARQSLGVFQPTITDFLASGSYTIPTGAQQVQMIGLGGGGGGGSGRRGTSLSQRFGGGGGGSSGLSDVTYDVSEIGGAGTVLTVTVGAGGAGGAAQTTNDTSGAAGSVGGETTVVAGATVLLGVAGGGAGFGGTAAAGAGGAATAGMFSGIAGSGSSTSTTPGVPVSSYIVAGAGGAGGGIDASDVARAGGPAATGGRAWTNVTGTGAAGGATGAAGANGAAVARGAPGSGGAGGGAGSGGAGGAGGAATRGGGGGGGGASVNGSNSGAGGPGGDGFVRIYAW